MKKIIVIILIFVLGVYYIYSEINFNGDKTGKFMSSDALLFIRQ